MSQGEAETYTLERAGETLGVSVADIQAYIEEGLVEPRCDQSGGQFFTRVEMRRLWSIVTLHRDLGINLPGVAAVLRLREQFERVRQDLATLIEIVERELGPDAWDRLWPQGRPRPSADAAADGSGGPPPPAETSGRGTPEEDAP